MENTNPIKQQDIEYMVGAHNKHPRKPSKAFRKFDGKTPFYFHPLWCATTISTESKLSTELRERGALVLLYHDVPEDTTLQLPDWLEKMVKVDIRDMTYENFEDETMRIWQKPTHIKLFKLYDKTSNLLDGGWMNEEKRKIYNEYTGNLLKIVREEYGELNITKIAGAVIR